MKRKRGVGKRKPKKPSVAGANDAPVDPGYYSEENNDVGSGKEIESRDVNTNESGQLVGLDKPAIGNNTVGGGAAKLAWAMSSSRTNRVSLQRETTGQKEPKSSQQDPVYKNQDLDAAQSVIKIIMEMDAAVPFNTPVDPIALGIPDYFDIIDTPMDFGTICSKLENGLKYRNSEEVFKDVQLIWDNCCKYNKDGSYIVDLMKRVKNNFMKQWATAGLLKEQQTVSNGHAHRNLQVLADSTMRREGVGSMYSPAASTMRHGEEGHMYLPASPSRREEAGNMYRPSSVRHSDTEHMYRPASSLRHEEAGHMHRPSSSTRHEDAEHMNRPSSTMRHEEAGHMYRPSSSMRHEGAEHMSRPASSMRHEEAGHMYRPSSSMRHEESSHLYRPASSIRHEEAGNLYRPASSMRHEDTEHMYRPASTIRHDEAEHMYRPASTMRHEEAEYMYRPASTMRHEELEHMYPNKSAYLEQHDWNRRQHQQLPPSYTHTLKPHLTHYSRTPHDLAPRNNHYMHSQPVDTMNGKSYSQWGNEAGPSLVRSPRPSPSRSSMGPSKQRALMHHSSSSQLPPSQSQAGINAHSAEHMHLPHREHRFSSGRDAIDGYHPNQYQMDPVQVQAYHPSVSRVPVHQLNPSSFQQLQSSHVEGGRNIDYAGNMHVPPPTESTANCTKRGTEYPQAPLTDKTSSQNLDQINSSPENSSSSMANVERCQALEGTCQNDPESSPSERFHSTADNNSAKRKTRGEGLVQGEEQAQLSPMMNSQEHQPLPQSQQSPPAEDYTIKLTKKTRGRGPTFDVPVREGERIPVAFNRQGQPVGPMAIKLVSYLGTLARNGHYSPLIYPDWRAVPMENKEKMWEKVQSKFDIDPMNKEFIMRSISGKWRDWKARVKLKNYYPYKTDEERLAQCDERVLPDQWPVLVKLWSTEEMQKCSEKNRANTVNHKYTHATGRKSFARIREEQKACRPDGKEPSRAELFIMTRTRKNGKPVNEASSEVIAKLRNREKDQNNPEDKNKQGDALLEIIGADGKGRPRCSELGPSPAEFGGLKRSHAETFRMVSEANSEIREVKERMTAMEQTCALMATQMATMMSMMSSIQKKAAFNSGSHDHPAPQPPRSETPSEGSTGQADAVQTHPSK